MCSIESDRKYKIMIMFVLREADENEVINGREERFTMLYFSLHPMMIA